MRYTILEISTTKFKINGYSLFKTFLPVFIDEQHIKVVNIHDTSFNLVESVNVSEIEVDGIAYTTSNDLIDNLHDVVYARDSAGTLDAQQIENNRLEIVAIKENSGSSFDANLYYNKVEIDGIIDSLPDSQEPITEGDVDGETMNFKNTAGNTIFGVDVSTLLAQATIIESRPYRVRLKDVSGNILSTANVIPDLIDINAVYEDGSVVDKTNKWVIGQKDGINDDNPFIGYCTVSNPTTSGDISIIMISK